MTMSIRNLLGAALAASLLAVPAFAAAQRQLHIDKDHFKVDTRKAAVHPRRLAVNTKDGRHQPRVLGKKNRHTVRKNVRGVTHHLTTPHHPKK